MELNQITENIIGAAIEVHKTLGAGLLESVYEECLCYELASRDVGFHKQYDVSLAYKEIRLDAYYKLDLFVENAVVVELKTVEKLLPIHDAQLLTYMKLVESSVDLLINFNVPYLRQGIKRKVLDFRE
ncbi:MAG: GxxExxY protein [Gammaproteobacteria bacterium]|nr:GxxExxY protein [Gammaproteobacteria bacterium]